MRGRKTHFRPVSPSTPLQRSGRLKRWTRFSYDCDGGSGIRLIPRIAPEMHGARIHVLDHEGDHLRRLRRPAREG